MPVRDPESVDGPFGGFVAIKTHIKNRRTPSPVVRLFYLKP
jgi:hypothetical protein